MSAFKIETATKNICSGKNKAIISLYVFSEKLKIDLGIRSQTFMPGYNIWVKKSRYDLGKAIE